ncbi:class I SAM-dependent methyltransferase [Cognatishimia sp. F0-27]|uniref:class I SAM-dependent methyltransferase n=1 Tax=Cognatishimia sp. F0-27 TaxID=2816855 RepID=UPI001D0C4CB2|nr:class I SAM-dependent methyltransferase [Cognatishimia sp. F0-27]MCC1492021.1 class I SAM-dependent methyltransferase [Cognatishimia sp. F0-27]
MSSPRLRFAIDHGALDLPESGAIALWGAPGDAPLDALDPARVRVIQRFAPDFRAWDLRGVPVTSSPEGPYAASIVTMPRARDLAETRLAEAEQATPGGLIVVDGAKTDGIDSLLKALKSRVTLLGQTSKAHGKIAWFEAGDALADWLRPAMSRNVEGDLTAPGVFSADGADAGSVLLAESLPRLKGRVADLGAGWGWLSREILRQDTVTSLHLVEADKAALACAERNCAEQAMGRAEFHWADARDWLPPEPLDALVMNPPFHTGRAADPALGLAFIDAAARVLKPQGQLWLVSNRHLPYETRLATLFRDHGEIAGNNRFKILHAQRPSSSRAGR